MSRIATIRDTLERQIEEARLRWQALQAEADDAYEAYEALVARADNAPSEGEE